MRPWRVNHPWTIAALILPLGLDTLALSAGLGAAGLRGSERLRVGLTFSAFEAVMPLIGFLVGRGVGSALGSVGNDVAAIVLAGLGVYMLWPGGADDDEKIVLLERARGLAILGLGLSISMDELAIGFGSGLLRLPLIVLVVAIGLQAFIVTQIGMRIGARLGGEGREWAERVAGVLLIAAAMLIFAS
ncbi:MAG TPA: manganese efflux pump [Chloroflexota bacterium]|nr:manganese efflux pump [Chloroflexota bacterium]